MRTVIRLRNRQLQMVDDLLLLFACVCLTSSTILLVIMAPSLDFFATLFADAASITFSENQVKALFDLGVVDHSIQKYTYAHAVLAWTAIFFIKFCYLSFFRLLVDRLRRLIWFWKFVLGISVVFLGFSICSSFIACPYLGLKGCG